MHKVYLYRDIWKGIETCQHQKARQHFIACESEQEHSWQLWSSAGNKPLRPVFLTHRLLFHTETSLFTAFILVFNGMNGDSSSGEWDFTEVGSGRVWAGSWRRFGPQYRHLQQGGGRDPPRLAASLPSPARPDSPDLEEGHRDAGTEENRTRMLLLYFHIKTKALWPFATVRLSLCNVSPCAGGPWHRP